MMSHSFIGSHLLALAAPSAVAGLAFHLVGERKRHPTLLRSAERAVTLNFLLITGAVVVLISAFLSNDFSILYVFRYSNITLPVFYKVTGLWAGLDGSLLFWTWLVSIYAVVVVRQNRLQQADWIPSIAAVLMGIILFFLALLLFANNPFALNDQPAVDGRGLNPLLQNLAMVFHPPTLYLGYTGFSVPFAFAVAALLTGRLDSSWIDLTRKWTMTAWFFLTVGLILGGAWAYVELGWGGFWAWDPVENAALMPWLTSTAYLHSVMIQKRRGMLVTWNLVLISLTFMLTLFGTYLTRSGVVQSVHAFSESKLGPYFLSFLGGIALGVILLLWRRRRHLKTKNELHSILSKEAAFLFNNLVLVVAAVSVLWGTLFPTLSEAVTGERISVGTSFFNRIMAPLGVALLFLMGIGPMISWKKASFKTVARTLTGPTLLGFAVFILTYLLGYRNWYVLASLALIAFVFGTIFLEFYRGHRALKSHAPEGPFFGTILTLVIRANKRYGGYIIHIGILLIFLGIAGAVFKKEADFSLAPNEVFSFSGYELRYEKPEMRQTPHKAEVTAHVTLMENGRLLDHLKPAKFIYLQGEQPSTEVDIFHAPFEDVYLIIGGIDPQSKQAEFRVTINPLISFIWIGGFVILLGMCVVMMPSRKAALAVILLPFLSGPIGAAFSQEPVDDPPLDPVHTGSVEASFPPRVYDVGRKLICQCGDCVRMSLADCPCGFAKKERGRIEEFLSHGMKEEAILREFVAQYGLKVLVSPPEKGFFLSGYFVPPILLGVGVPLVGLIVYRWGRRRRPRGAEKGRGESGKDFRVDPYVKKIIDESSEGEK